MSEWGKKISGLVVGVAISVATLWYLLSGLDWQLFSAELAKANWFYLPLLVLLSFVSLWLRAVRWQYLLPNGGELSQVKLTEAVIIGFFATFILPFRAGEVIRPLVLSRWQPVRFSVGLASIVTERAFDIIALLLYLLLCASELENAPSFVGTGVKVLGVMAATIVLAILVCYKNADRLSQLGERLIMTSLGKHWPTGATKIVSILTGLLEGLAAVGSFKNFTLASIWSLILWAEIALMYYVGFWMFGEFPPILAGMTVSVLIAFAVAAPSAPGFIGVFQLGCVAGISGIYGYSKEFALAYSLVLHSYQVICAVVMGIFVLKYEGLGLREIMKRQRFEEVPVISSA